MATVRDLSLQHPHYQSDKAFYDRVRAAKPQYELVDKFIIPSFSGRGFIVKKGQSFRAIQEEGPEVGDVAFYHLHNPKESFSSLRTWEMEGFFLRVYSRMWSDVPYFRPMATCIEETLDSGRSPGGWHHHVVASHCSPEQGEMDSGRAGLNACRLNLLQAIEPFGLTEEDIHDNIDIHQKWRLEPKEGRYYLAPTDKKVGSYIEFYAEMDLLVAISACPDGDGTRHFSLPEDPPTLPLGIEIYDTGIEPTEFPNWSE